jgi:hypothetical protein
MTERRSLIPTIVNCFEAIRQTTHTIELRQKIDRLLESGSAPGIPISSQKHVGSLKEAVEQRAWMLVKERLHDSAADRQIKSTLAAKAPGPSDTVSKQPLGRDVRGQGPGTAKVPEDSGNGLGEDVLLDDEGSQPNGGAFLDDESEVNSMSLSGTSRLWSDGMIDP